MTSRFRSLLVPACLLAIALAGPVSGAEPTPTPEPGAARDGSLTDAAGGRELRGAAATRDETGTIVITDDTLATLAARGGVTEATGTPAADLLAGEGEGGPVSRREAWRRAYAEQKELIAALAREIARLDQRIPELWNEFYAADDPSYRDGVIKPELDESLMRRDELERSLAAERPKLEDILEAARRDGAEPGWFRDLVE